MECHPVSLDIERSNDAHEMPTPTTTMPQMAGMEYVRTHNLALARNFLMGALSLSPADPLVLNEVRCRRLFSGVLTILHTEYFEPTNNTA